MPGHAGPTAMQPIKPGVHRADDSSMRLLILACLAMIGVALLGHTLLRGAHHRIALALVLILALPLAVGEWRWQDLNRAATRATARIAGPGTGADCQRLTGTFAYAGAEWGHVYFDPAGRPDTRAFLSYQACERLAAWWRSDHQNPPMEQIQAVHTVSHEAVHLTGILNEARTECLAVQQDARTTVSLGATPEQGRALAEAYWRLAYPRMPDPYRSSACGPDGPWDLTPGDGLWP